MPLISVIIPSYNRELSISKAIESVIHQSFQDWELIIIDDGSEDNTRKVVRNYLEETRIRYFFQENRGVSFSRNKGADFANGKYLIFLDSDDYVKENWLKNFQVSIESFPDIPIFQSGYELIIATTGKKQTFLPGRASYSPPLTGTFIINSDLFLSLGGYDDFLTFGENTELFIRIEKSKSQVKLIEFADLVYQESLDGGSKNLLNMNSSIHYTLDKHHDFMTPRVKWLYNQIAGVNFLRLGKYPEASSDLWSAFLYQPWKLDTFLRWIFSKLPFLAKKIYKVKTSNG